MTTEHQPGVPPAPRPALRPAAPLPTGIKPLGALRPLNAPRPAIPEAPAPSLTRPAPAPEPEAAQAASPGPEQDTAAPDAAAQDAPAAARPGLPRRLAAVKLPAPGGSVSIEATRELWNRFLAAGLAADGPQVAMTRESSDRILELFSAFLFGKHARPSSEGDAPDAPLPAADPASILELGGLARLFDVRLRPDVAFKLTTTDGRIYPNPRTDAPPGTLTRISGRKHVRLLFQSEKGTSETGHRGPHGEFVPAGEN